MPNLNRKPSFTKRKLLLLGFLFVVLLVIPITVYLVGQQQALRSEATPSTTLSFVPESQTAPLGSKVDFDVWVTPGNNQVNFIKLVVKYDSTKLSITEEGFTVNPASNLSIIQGPVIGAAGDEIAVALSVENDSTKVIQQDTKIGTLSFDVTGESETPTQISFYEDAVKGIEIRSINGANQDAFDENVYVRGAQPASVTIQDGDVTPTPGADVTLTPTPVDDLTPTPGVALTPTPTSTTSGGATPSLNQSPVCESLVTDRSPTGDAPLAITFTVNGSDLDGTITKATFSFGDGTIEDETVGGGIGTDIVNVQKSHTYMNSGTFTASALLTDDSSGVSENSNCAVTVTVGGDGTASVTPLADTGPTETIVGVGALGGILFLIGALLFFAL